MTDKPSRREILGKGALAAASLAIPLTVTAQEPPKEAPIDTSEVEKNLAKPLSDEAKKLLPNAVKSNRANHENRLKTPLPENSEPCFVYPVTPKGWRP